MFLTEPPQTQWDLHFQLLGIRVRISPFFWVVAALLGWSLARGMAERPELNFNVGVALVIWIIGVLLSILVHEFGHAMAFRYYGIDSDVVLYHFGGLAVPRSSWGLGRQASLDSKQNIVVSAAGPAAQLMLAIAVAAVFWIGGYVVLNPLPFLRQLDFLMEGKPLPSPALAMLQLSLVGASVWWALLNLLPVYPLDGGRISRDAFLLANHRTGIRHSLILSIITGAGVALWAFSNQQPFLGIMFAMLAYSSYTILQSYSGRGGGFGGPW